MRIKGIDTVKGLVGEPPMEISVPVDAINIGDKLREVWNHSHLAFIPYCFKCKEAVDWYSPPEDGLVFECPKCGRKWYV